MVYEQAYAVAPWTLVTHMTMLTGLGPRQHGVFKDDRALSPEVPLLAERLQARGYQTFGFYFPGWIHERHGFGRGFDVFLPHADAEQAGRNLEQALAKRNPNLPFFLFLHLFDIHSKGTGKPGGTFYEPPPPYDTFFDPTAPETLRGLPFKRIHDGEGRLTDEQIDALIALYDGGIRYVDTKLSEWIEAWRADGLLDDTLLIVTADHGDSLATREGGIQGHGGMYQEGLHIPLVVRFPEARAGEGHGGWDGDRRAGQRVSDLVSQTDLLPTVLDFLGLPRESWLSGYSLLEGRPPDTVLHAERPPQQALIQWPWKVVVGRLEGGGRAYHLEQDPAELSPLHDLMDTREEYRELQERLSAAFEAEFAGRLPIDAEPIPASTQDPDQAQALKDLGYAGY